MMRNENKIGPYDRERGAALLPVILLLGLLAMLATSFSVYVSNSATAIAVARDRIMQETLVQSALSFGMGRVFSTPAGTAIIGEDRIRLVSGRATLSWRADNARLDLNYADQAWLASLLETLDLNTDKAKALANLIVARRSLNPAQPVPKEFQALALLKLGPYEHPRELLDLPGMSSAIYARLEPLITVYGSSPAIDPRLADEALLESIPNISRPILAELATLRGRNDEETKSRLGTLGELQRYFDVTRKPVIRLEIETELTTGQQRRFEIVTTSFPDDREPYRILMWRETPKAK